MPPRPSEIGAVAAQALDDIHSAIYGRAPKASRAWTDGDAILLVMRLPAESAARRSDPPLGAIQRMVERRRLPPHRRALRTAGTNVDAQRGLVVLAFERTARRAATRTTPGRSPPARLLGAG